MEEGEERREESEWKMGLWGQGFLGFGVQREKCRDFERGKKAFGVGGILGGAKEKRDNIDERGG